MAAARLIARSESALPSFASDFVRGLGAIQAAHAYPGLGKSDLQALMAALPRVRREFWLLQAATGEVLGTIGAALSSTVPRRGFIGFYGLMPAARSADAVLLLDTARTWLRARGAEFLVGPVQLNTWFPYRLQDSHFQDSLASWEPQSPAVYREHWRAAQFVPVRRYYSEATQVRLAAFMPLLTQDAGALKAGYSYHPFLWEDFATAVLPDLFALTLTSYGGADLFEALTMQEMQDIYLPLLRRDKSKLVGIFVDTPQGEPCGYLFGFQEPQHFVLKTIAVAPAHRRLGLVMGMLRELLRQARLPEAEPVIVSALLRDNNASGQIPELLATHGRKLWRHEYVLFGTGIEHE